MWYNWLSTTSPRGKGDGFWVKCIITIWDLCERQREEKERKKKETSSQFTELNSQDTPHKVLFCSVRSAVPPALLDNSWHTLLILPFVFLVKLSCLTVSRTVWIWFIKQRLRIINRGKKADQAAFWFALILRVVKTITNTMFYLDWGKNWWYVVSWTPTVL